MLLDYYGRRLLTALFHNYFMHVGEAATFSFPCSGVFLSWVSFLFAKANVSIEIIGSGQGRQNPGCRMLCIAYKRIVSGDGFFLKVYKV